MASRVRTPMYRELLVETKSTIVNMDERYQQHLGPEPSNRRYRDKLIHELYPLSKPSIPKILLWVRTHDTHYNSPPSTKSRGTIRNKGNIFF